MDEESWLAENLADPWRSTADATPGADASVSAGCLTRG
jgi:hypothetical protein